MSSTPPPDEPVRDQGSAQPAGPVAPVEPLEPATKPPSKAKRHGLLRELPALLLISFLLAILIKTFLVQAFYIPSESMEPTLMIGDRVLVNRLVYRFHPPGRQDVIVFSDPNAPPVHRNPAAAFLHWLGSGFGAPTNSNKDFIKRVIGLPGDTVEIDGRGQVYVNGRQLHEPYLNAERENRLYGPVKVPPDSLFVLGDNRKHSGDSRYGLGFIPYDKVIGRAFVIIWPPSRLGGLHGP
jgi:signal peptidase I